MRRKKTSVGGVLRVTAIVICILVILACCGYLLNYWLQSQKNAKLLEDTAATYLIPPEEEEVEVYVLPEAPEADGQELEEIPIYISKIDFTALLAQSEDVCAWIQIPSLDKINMPVVWSGDDSFYLTHAWDGSYTAHGAIFVEALNDRSFSDAYTVLYGHNMKDGSMFGSLKKYADADFYQENGGLILIYLPDQLRIYQIFSARYVSPDDEGTYTVGFANDEPFGEYVAKMADASLYDTGVTVTQEDQVITLSTCAGEQRFVVHAKLIDTVG